MAELEPESNTSPEREGCPKPALSTRQKLLILIFPFAANYYILNYAKPITKGWQKVLIAILPNNIPSIDWLADKSCLPRVREIRLYYVLGCIAWSLAIIWATELS